MGKSGSSSTSEGTIRYAPYIEAHHEDFLDTSNNYGDTIRETSPFDGYTDLDFADAFYGAGYAISSFPSLYDMYGKFMAGLDVCVLFGQVLDDVQHKPTIEAATVAHAELLDDDLEQTALPRFEEGLRDINAVMASSFVIGKSIIEQGRTKKLAEFDANLRYKLIPVASDVWTKHLNWNAEVINTYLKMQNHVINSTLVVQDKNYTYQAKNTLWPFTVLDYERANIAALQGATNTKSTTEKEGSPLGMVLSAVGMIGSLML